MNYLRGMHPLTNCGHVLMGPTVQAAPGVRQHLTSMYTKAGPVLPPVAAGTSLQEALEFLRAAVNGPFPSRFLLAPAQGGRTVLFNNAWRSHGLFEMADSLTSILGVDDVFFLAQPNTIRKVDGELHGQYGARQWIRSANGRTVRHIELINDSGRWSFSTRGEPEPFERTAAYEAPRKPDRFTQAMIEEYLGAMGLFPFREDFYTVDAETPAIGLEIDVTEPGERTRLAPTPLEEIQSFYGPFD